MLRRHKGRSRLPRGPSRNGNGAALVARVSIADHGRGIPADVLPRIFEAFFTTKPQGSGTGLGLEIVHRIVTQKFGGKIDVESQPGNTRFVVRLPLGGVSNGIGVKARASLPSASKFSFQ